MKEPAESDKRSSEVWKDTTHREHNVSRWRGAGMNRKRVTGLRGGGGEKKLTRRDREKREEKCK